jgi:hypothetical protein
MRKAQRGIHYTNSEIDFEFSTRKSGIPGAGSGLFVEKQDIPRHTFFAYNQTAIDLDILGKRNPFVSDEAQFNRAYQRCVSPDASVVFNMISMMCNGPIARWIARAVVKAGGDLEKMERIVFEHEELESFSQWAGFLIENGNVKNLRHITTRAGLRRSICSMWLMTAVPRPGKATVPTAGAQREIAVLMFQYLSRYTVTVPLQVPEVFADGTIADFCNVSKVQLVEGADGTVSGISYELLRQFTEQELAKGRRPKKVMKVREISDVVERVYPKGRTEPNESGSVITFFEYTFVCDGNGHASHLQSIIDASEGNKDARAIRTIWKPAEPMLMGFANDPNYATVSAEEGRKAPAPVGDIVTFMHAHGRKKSKKAPPTLSVHPHIRVHSAVPAGSELFISYDAGSAKCIRVPNPIMPSATFDHLKLLARAAKASVPCNDPRCEKMRSALDKVRTMPYLHQAEGRIWRLLRIHAHFCRLAAECPVPHCGTIKAQRRQQKATAASPDSKK